MNLLLTIVGHDQLLLELLVDLWTPDNKLFIATNGRVIGWVIELMTVDKQSL